MSKLGCDCGHVIIDQTDSLPYKAALLKNQDEDAFYAKVCADLASFAQATRDGTRAEWIAKHFLPAYPQNLPDEDVIHDYLSSALIDRMVAVYECEQCGAVWIERGDIPNRFGGYQPKIPGEPGILASRRH